MSLEIASRAIARPRAPFLSQPARRMLILGALVALVVVLFMTLNARGHWGFVLRFRGTKLAAMALVAYAIAVSTVLFQTASHNRILSPSIMGFDALYVLIQTGLVFALGAQRAVAIHPQVRFLAEVFIMVAFAGLLYRWLFDRSRRSLHLLILVGIIFGVLFRSATSMMQRMIDPNDFSVLQDLLFASFNSFDRQLLLLSALLIGGASLAAWRIAHTFDVLALGRETAVNLGVDYQRTVSIILVVVTIMVSVSTALVGPVTFFGLLVANLAYLLIGTHRHRWVLPCAVALSLLCLVGGQLIVERLFAFNTSLSIIVEFFGGIMFIVLLIRGIAR